MVLKPASCTSAHLQILPVNADHGRPMQHGRLQRTSSHAPKHAATRFRAPEDGHALPPLAHGLDTGGG
eukprot:9212752-Pyramimonas_sp.AAC.1